MKHKSQCADLVERNTNRIKTNKPKMQTDSYLLNMVLIHFLKNRPVNFCGTKCEKLIYEKQTFITSAKPKGYYTTSSKTKGNFKRRAAGIFTDRNR